MCTDTILIPWFVLAGKSTVVQLIADIYNNNPAIVGYMDNNPSNAFPLEHLVTSKVRC